MEYKKNELILYKNDLIEYSKKHKKRTRVTKNPGTQIRQTLYLISPIMKANYNAKPYFLTITFKESKKPILQQWNEAVSWMESFKKEISKHFMIVGAIISIEPHTDSSLQSKRGKNTKSGMPHFHAVIWISHEFLNPEIEMLKLSFIKNNVFAKISKLKYDIDAIKALLYTIKDKDEVLLQDICKHVTKWDSNINVWINHEHVKKTLQLINIAADGVFFESQECYIEMPTTRYHKDKGLLLAELYTKIFRLKNLAVKDQVVYEKTENTQFSWTRREPLKDWIANNFMENAPVKYLQMLKQNAYWVSTQGKTFKEGINYEFFPRLEIQFFLVEFADKAYQFKYGKTFEFNEIGSETNSICYVNENFNQIKPPFITLALLFTLLNKGHDKTIIAQTKKEITSDTKDFITAWRRLQIALTAIGGLYHFDVHRKINKTVYFRGEPNSYKTAFFKALLDKLIGLDHVDVISRNNSQFNFANLRKQNGQPYLLIMDDLRWEALGMEIPDFLNLLDGTFVRTEQKYMPAVTGALQGNIAITSNQTRDQRTRSDVDNKALKARTTEVILHPLNEKNIFVNENINLIKALESEAIAFSILTNMIFLKYQCNTSNGNLNIPDSFFIKNLQQQQPTLESEKGGAFLLQKIMENFKN